MIVSILHMFGPPPFIIHYKCIFLHNIYAVAGVGISEVIYSISWRVYIGYMQTLHHII